MFIFQDVITDLLDLLMVATQEKVEWRSAIMKRGVLFVMISGMKRMPLLHANRLDTPDSVGFPK